MSIESYLESGELPNDPAELERLYQEAIGAEATTELVEAGESASAATSAAVESEKEPDGIATKDGKHIIGYDVLKAERQQRQDAEKNLADLKAEIERFKNAPAQADLSAIGVMTDQELEDLKEYFPEQYEKIVAQQSNIVSLQQRDAQRTQEDRQREDDRQRQVSLNVQEEIDNNPTLSHWQRADPDAFNYCVQQDNLLRDNPKTADLPLGERFAKAVAMALQVYESPIKAPAKAAIAPTKAVRPLINSLSDIPGGEPVEASEKQRLEDSSTAELGNRFMKMTDDQRQAYLNSLG